MEMQTARLVVYGVRASSVAGAAERSEKTAKRNAAAAATTVTEAIAADAGTAGQLDQARTTLATRTAEAASMRAGLTALIGPYDLDANDEEVLAVVIAPADRAHEAAIGAGKHLGEIRAQAAKTGAEATAQHADGKRRTKALDKERGTLAQLRRSITALLADLPDVYRPTEPTVAAIDAQTKHASTDQEVLAQQWRDLTTLQDNVAQMARMRAAVAERRTQEIIKPAATCRQGHHRTGRRLSSLPCTRSASGWCSWSRMVSAPCQESRAATVSWAAW
jgi:hypothetical protein